MRLSRWLSVSGGLIVVVSAAGLAGGCTSEPFTRQPLPYLQDPDPARIRAAFAAATPARFISDDTVVIDSLFQDTTVLAYLRVDRDARTFDLLGLNPAGVQLFLLSAERDQTRIKSAIGPLQKEPKLLLGLADDIRRIYFDLVPDDLAQVDTGRKVVRFTSRGDAGTIRFEYGDDPIVLLEKRHSRWWGTDWRIQYFDYVQRSGRYFPKGIILDNRRFRYRIVIKNRDWSHE